MEIKLTWYQAIFFWLVAWTVRIIFLPKLERYTAKRREVKRKLKYFNPVLSEGFWGKKITWIGRVKPLSKDQVNELYS